MLTGMSRMYINKVYQIWCSYDDNGDGHLSREEFLAIPEIHHSPLRERLYLMLDLAAHGAADGGGEVTFNAFVLLLSVMSIDGPLDQKMVYAFRMIDINDDGRIDPADLKEYLSMIATFDSSVEEDTRQELLDQAVANTMAEASSNGIFISVEDFQKSMFVCDDFAQRFTLNIKKRRKNKKGDKYKVEDENNEEKEKKEDDKETAANKDKETKEENREETESLADFDDVV